MEKTVQHLHRKEKVILILQMKVKKEELQWLNFPVLSFPCKSYCLLSLFACSLQDVPYL